MSSQIATVAAIEATGPERVPCPNRVSCHAMVLRSRTHCPYCGTSLEEAPKPAPAKKKKAAARKASSNPVASRNKNENSGSLGDRVLTLVVRGLPISQGSGEALAPGVFRHSNSEQLKGWRELIQAESRRVCGANWIAPNCAVHVSVVFTVKPLKRLRKAQPVEGYRDLDKLTRAIGDALAPRSGHYTIADDMRIANWQLHKTYPSPFHTHPSALREPGAVITVQRAPVTSLSPVGAEPCSTLT